MLNAYKIETFEDILKALRERPEWLEELRRIILTEELISLPQKFDTFLQRDFKPLKEKVEKIESDTEVLKQDVAVLKQDVAILKQDVAILKQDVAILKQDVAVLKNDVAELKGDNFERIVRERAPSYFGRLIKRCKVINFEELAEILENAVERGVIKEDEMDDVLKIDVVATGLLKKEDKKVVIVGEVSIKTDTTDVERAYRRAEIMSRAMGISSIAVVVGKESTEGAIKRAEEIGVLLV